MSYYYNDKYVLFKNYIVNVGTSFKNLNYDNINYCENCLIKIDFVEDSEYKTNYRVRNGNKNTKVKTFRGYCRQCGKLYYIEFYFDVREYKYVRFNINTKYGNVITYGTFFNINDFIDIYNHYLFTKNCI